ILHVRLGGTGPCVRMTVEEDVGLSDTQQISIAQEHVILRRLADVLKRDIDPTLDDANCLFWIGFHGVFPRSHKDIISPLLRQRLRHGHWWPINRQASNDIAVTLHRILPTPGKKRAGIELVPKRSLQPLNVREQTSSAGLGGLGTSLMS